MFSFNTAKLHKQRLQSLNSHSYEISEDYDLDFNKIIGSEKNLDAKLIDAGFIDVSEQLSVKYRRNILLLGGAVLFGILAFFLYRTMFAVFIGVIAGLYSSALIWVTWVKVKTKDVVRSCYFDLPLILEELILLIESGLGLFPAMERVCSIDFEDGLKDLGLCRKVFKKAYSLASHGMPISQAFSVVSRSVNCVPLKQVLIHLDVSASVGGELLVSLRALSEQVHREWKMQVETRVKKLENFVVFPVFMAVMGLLLLTAAVPLVPVFEFMTSLKKGSAAGGAINQPASVDSVGNSSLNQVGGL